MRKFLSIVTGLSLTALLVAGITFRLTHHPVYHHCHRTDLGISCTLRTWEVNK